MRATIYPALVLSFLLASPILAQPKELPKGPNVTNEWSQEEGWGDIRILYNYFSPESKNFTCRVDYYYDGKIRLLATEGYYHIPNFPISTVSTFYTLRPTSVPDTKRGNELVRVSYKVMAGPRIEVEPTTVSEDQFTKRCIPLLNDLFSRIPAAEVKIWKDQFGSVFGIK